MVKFKGQISPLFAKTIKLDLRDKKIIQYCLVNPRVPNSKIARDLRIHKSSVARRIGQLQKKEILLEPILITDLSAFGMKRYCMSFIINKQCPREVIEKLCKLPFVSSVITAIGKFQLIIYFD